MVLLLQAQGVKIVLMTTAHTHWHTLTNSVLSKRDGTHIKEHSGSKEDVCQGQNHQPGQGWHQEAWKGSKLISIICPSINYGTQANNSRLSARYCCCTRPSWDGCEPCLTQLQRRAQLTFHCTLWTPWDVVWEERHTDDAFGAMMPSNLGIPCDPDSNCSSLASAELSLLPHCMASFLIHWGSQGCECTVGTNEWSPLTFCLDTGASKDFYHVYFCHIM